VENSLFIKNTFMKQRRVFLHQQLTYVCGLVTVQSVYVCGLTQNRERTPLILFKNKKTRKNYRVGKSGMHLGGHQNPLIDSTNLIETQKENKKPINHPKNT
jgi:hypothetical protein